MGLKHWKLTYLVLGKIPWENTWPKVVCCLSATVPSYSGIASVLVQWQDCQPLPRMQAGKPISAIPPLFVLRWITIPTSPIFGSWSSPEHPFQLSLFLFSPFPSIAISPLSLFLLSPSYPLPVFEPVSNENFTGVFLFHFPHGMKQVLYVSLRCKHVSLSRKLHLPSYNVRVNGSPTLVLLQRERLSVCQAKELR